MLEYKAATLAEHGVQPSAERRAVADRPAAGLADGVARQPVSMPTQPTAWLAEGLLMYLPADAQDRLFEQITELSAPGSRVAAETVGVHVRRAARSRCGSGSSAIAAQFGMRARSTSPELMYNDPDRADVAEWLNAHGWRADALSPPATRCAGSAAASSCADATDEAFSTFVTGEKGLTPSGAAGPERACSPTGRLVRIGCSAGQEGHPP